MELLKFLIDLFLHLDEHLATIISQYGSWTYGILFAVIFVETGFVIMPILPGDSLLFAAGTFAALPDGLNIWYLVILLIIAAILGDTVNYAIGHYLGERAYNIKWIKFDSGADVNTAFIAKELDFGALGSSPVARGLSAPLNIPYKVAFVLDVAGDNEALIARNGTNINSIPELRGKRVATPFASPDVT